MTAGDIITLGMSIFANPNVVPIATAVIGVSLFGSVVRGLRSFFA